MILTFLMMAVLLIACVSLLFIPWQSQDSISRDQLNNLIYQQRLQELEQESSLSDSQQQTMLVTDLQRNLLEDIPVTLKTNQPQEMTGFISPVLLFSHYSLLVCF